MKVLIIGHKNPDTDSVASVISYAELKNKTDSKNQYIPAIAGEINNETKFVLDYFKIPVPKVMPELSKWKDKLIILDTTLLSQLPFGLNEEKIIEIIDHHRLAEMQTTYPFFGRMEPIGSTCSIVAKIFKEKKIILPVKIAGLIASGIISDTLFLRGPTTTVDDKTILSELNKVAKLKSLSEYASRMFGAKSDLSNVSMTEIVANDYKKFIFGKKKVGIAAIETVNPKSVIEVKNKIIEAVKKLKKKERLDLVYALVIDILNLKNDMLIIGEEEQRVAEKVFGGKTRENILSLGNRISRKKQIVPPLEKFLK
jgi:manganese-dependent inorganic pyrophosphatase